MRPFLSSTSSAVSSVTLKVAGSMYLVYLGVRSLVDALRRTGADRTRHANGHAGPDSRVSLRQGLISNLGNPKIAVFFTSFLPVIVYRGEVYADVSCFGGQS